MNEAIMLMMLYSGPCVVTQESQPSTAGASCSSFSYTHTAGLVDFGRTDVVTQRERSASLALISGWKVTACLPLQREAKQK